MHSTSIVLLRGVRVTTCLLQNGLRAHWEYMIGSPVYVGKAENWLTYFRRKGWNIPDPRKVARKAIEGKLVFDSLLGKNPVMLDKSAYNVVICKNDLFSNVSFKNCQREVIWAFNIVRVYVLLASRRETKVPQIFFHHHVT